MRTLFTCSIFLAVALVARAEDVEKVITDETVQTLMAEVRAAVENETGSKLDPALKGRIATADEVADILAEELLPQMSILDPGGAKEQHQDDVRAKVAVYKNGVLGKFAPATSTFYVVRENFAKMATALDRPDINSRETLRCVMIHELAHAADHARYKMGDHFREIKTVEELQAWSAVVEGHAQFVTLKVLSREEGGERRFREFESLVDAFPAGMDESVKLILESKISEIRFAYFEGLSFFLALEKTDKGDFVSKVFAQPPKRRDEILHPERWGTTAAPPIRDMSKLWDVLKKQHDQDYTPKITNFGEADLRDMNGDLLTKERLDAAAKNMRGGSGLALFSKSDGRSKQMDVLVVELEDDKAAAVYFDFSSDLMKAMDAQFKTGEVRIKATYGELALKGGQRSIDASRTINTSADEMEMRDTLFSAGRFFVRMVWGGVPVTKQGVEAQAEMIIDFLSKE